MPAARVRILYSGRVQGVGFRYAAAAAARSLPVTGFVRNLDDGRVELVAEGEKGALESLLAGVRGKMEGFVGGEAADWAEASGEFTGFRIAH
ncbi:MAG: acylphosphatase [Planctomycetota bacterium]